MAISPVRHRFTVTDYHRMGEVGIFNGQRVELIEGEIIDMSPIGLRHNACVDHLNVLFIEGLGRRVVVRVQGSVRLNNRSEPQPDLALLRGRLDFYSSAIAGPDDVLLFVEVSDTTLAYDRGEKAALYARAGVPELWVVDINRQRLHVFREPGPPGYRVVFEVQGQAELSPLAFPDFVLTADRVVGLG